MRSQVRSHMTDDKFRAIAQDSIEASRARAEGIDQLYKRPLPSKRTGAIYNAFSYPTKIDAETVAVFIATHTQPGEVVLDPFGGSGSTGIAARLCDKPTNRMREMAADAGVAPVWGPRKAVVYELSPLGALIGQVMSNPPAPDVFANAASELIESVSKEFGWAYQSVSPDGRAGWIRHVIWSEVLQTPCCGDQLTLWDAAVEHDPLVLKKDFRCTNCAVAVKVSDCERVSASSTDSVTGEPTVQRERRPVMVYGESGGKGWSRPPTEDDLLLIERVNATQIDSEIPADLINWGDLHRSGYHSGITHFHHLYTGRNLRAMAEMWQRANLHQGNLRDALRLLVLSYNASHSTLLTRVVVKKDQKNFVVTGAQSGVLYISGLPVEKNVIKGLRRKVKTFTDAFALTYDSESEVIVVNGSSTEIDLTDDSVDYIFTDPPFGDFIPYAEVNQINEAWLGQLTDQTQEVIISKAQGKGVDEYAALMRGVFSETARVLRPDAAATVIFHASKPAVWEALGEAFRLNGLEVERTSVLDKTQVSFKQVVHEGGTRGDAVFMLRRVKDKAFSVPNDVGPTIRSLEESAAGDPDELAPRRMYSRYVAHSIETSSPVAFTAPEFYALVEKMRVDVVSSKA
jgi:16S rRNA G966 N2-methylase RsmD